MAGKLIEFNLGLEHIRSLQLRREYDQKLVGVSPGLRAALDREHSQHGSASVSGGQHQPISVFQWTRR